MTTVARRLATFALAGLSAVTAFAGLGLVNAAPAAAIKNGQPVPAGKYPWFVSMSGRCSGSLIAPSWVLTAAECVTNSPTATFEVSIGGEGYALDERRTVVEQIKHPDFKGWYDTTNRMWRDMNFNVALMRLNAPSSKTPVEMMNATDTGFVNNNSVATTMGMAYPLQEASLHVYDVGPIEFRMQDGYENGHNCDGDQGGPALVGTQAGAKLAGVISGLEACWVTYPVHPRAANLTNPVMSGWVRSMIHETPLVGDVTGDRRDDIVSIDHRNKKVRVAVSTGTGFAASGLWHDWMGHPGSTQLLADVNADGKKDLLTFDDTNVWVAVSTGTTFLNPANWYQGNVKTKTQEVLVGQMDYNNRADLILVDRAAKTVQVRLSQGTSFSAPYTRNSGITIPIGATIAADDAIAIDGYSDLVVFEAGNGGVRALGYNQNSATPVLLHDWFGNPGQTLTTGMMNNKNGDFFAFTRTASNNVWSARNAIGYAAHTNSRVVASGFGDANDTYAVGDVNGDGNSDLLRFTQDAEADVFVSIFNLSSGGYMPQTLANGTFAP